METALTPMDFARRARKADRCHRWSAALVKLGVGADDRVGTIAPNTHQHLELRRYRHLLDRRHVGEVFDRWRSSG